MQGSYNDAKEKFQQKQKPKRHILDKKHRRERIQKQKQKWEE